MLRKLCGRILFNLLGFTVEETIAKPNKYIIALAPHTSNWDFIIGQLFACATGQRSHFLMKKEWFRGPLGPLMRSLGGVPVHRDKSTSRTDQIAEIARTRDTFCLCITPEGTRKLQPTWKRGFYYIALKAKIPILLYGLDYKKKRIVCTKSVMPTGDIDRELPEIKRYFEQFTARHPKKFTTGL